ncbi:hypothetical protein PPROV_000754500 [Pycnococcus provasolii]|uniref:Saccharopine dehydrogenase NADP binding domain-containing protein n=3 Tax=Pycnococcus provasolii TaxID=41880 RepID=A0A830HPF8_9CHLO|nr:hypothetical protein PPROV_000754500 [Pycnococcus provasolii]|mmetsp:Transcript_10918/g.24548  ORF Transcript_10918/g.24548 Transcript_10918/m.24548 type:complete len:440 (+) Transcript_10918:44-1363(+)|eukprot:CAMPEP_0205958904 /NCGR_PEP_ID=MMETSP1459-20131121/53027_1 /ASSEMBLY_ACC=CAM_ASM_001120 /TAXON_ID=41880 /ORGANISM="Pycnococcus provasolii, Strain RCC931" /LENGTH=439 /DNA_ID=CAMNT_0053331457 /DNA_START=115 /DNA_END=1434 /DNA_ORIENTATION=-
MFDLLLFGVTGFTGKLALEYLLEKKYASASGGAPSSGAPPSSASSWSSLSLCVCARSSVRGDAAISLVKSRLVTRLGDSFSFGDSVPLEVADLVCKTKEQEDALRAIVKKTRVVISTAGPFEKYGQTLVKLCAEEGVHYADITGESDFVRTNIDKYDDVARKSGSVIVSHCGNDCIPWDLTVFEIHKLAKSKGGELVSASTFTELAPGSAMSGGTVTTAIFQAKKSRPKSRGGSAGGFDPLLRAKDGSKSTFSLTNTSPKTTRYFSEFQRSAGPWIMAPVMVNCVRRSNALLGISKDLAFGDCMLHNPSLWQWIKDKAYTGLIAASLLAPSIFKSLALVPSPGEGPSREFMENGWLKLHTRATVKDAGGKETKVEAMYTFNEDVGYLATAKMLVESGRLLLDIGDSVGGGVLTPASAFGSAIVQRLEQETGAKLEIKEL